MDEALLSLPKKKRHRLMVSQMELERASYTTHWKDVADFIMPRRPRFNVNDVNKGDRRNQKIVDATGTMAAKVLRAGMMMGISNPAREWFKVTTTDPDLYKFRPVKEFLDVSGKRLAAKFLKSNLYNCLPQLYGDSSLFATAPIFMEEDWIDTFRFSNLLIGSYSISNNARLQVDALSRRFKMTVRQLVEKFGKRKPDGKMDWSNFSTHVKDCVQNGNLEAWVEVVHVIGPNPEFNPEMLDSKFKRYESCYYEEGSHLNETEQGIYLREKGYDRFPVKTARWEIAGEDAWGCDCPGMTALGDIRGLQTMRRRKAQAVDKMVSPPMIGPTGLKKAKASMLPGDITYFNENGSDKMLRPMYEVNPRVQELMFDIQDTRGIINEAFYKNLFLMITSLEDKSGRSATEIDARTQEKLIVLGPVYTQLNQDVFDPIITEGFQLMLERGELPPLPEELYGQELKVEYVSIMAQAQKLAGLGGIERFTSFTINLGKVYPQVANKIDFNFLVEECGEIMSINPKIIRSDEQVKEIERQQAELQRQAQMAASMKDTTTAVKNLAQSNTEEPSALNDLINLSRAGQ